MSMRRIVLQMIRYKKIDMYSKSSKGYLMGQWVTR